jgi:hypothetical protein
MLPTRGACLSPRSAHRSGSSGDVQEPDVPDSVPLARGDQVYAPAGIAGKDTVVQGRERHVPALGEFADTRSVGLGTGVFENGAWGFPVVMSFAFWAFLTRQVRYLDGGVVSQV